ncbi:MAG: DUF2695 domain-containing protein [Actinomycetia bacterium]|nr:DUF2695 domain-containing protein [Actinomycetes bacterium]
MLDAFGRSGNHRFTERWRDAQPRRMPGLLRWVQANGGLCCDCEVLVNVFSTVLRADELDLDADGEPFGAL